MRRSTAVSFIVSVFTTPGDNGGGVWLGLTGDCPQSGARKGGKSARFAAPPRVLSKHVDTGDYGSPGPCSRQAWSHLHKAAAVKHVRGSF